MSCSIFRKSLIADIKDINIKDFDISWLSSMIPGYKPGLSGVWQPIWVAGTNSSIEYVEPLIKPRTGPSPTFNPCNCTDGSINPQDIEDQVTDYNRCNYCGTYSTSSSLIDNRKQRSPRSYTFDCCNGACDTRFKNDDFIQKIPVLNQSYITGLLDSKYHGQFPACNNQGLGKERFIKIPASRRNKILGPDLCIDWRLKETISEIPYDSLYSQHDSEYLHNKSYKKSQMLSDTCGNFIMLSLPETEEPSKNWYQEQYPILRGLIGTKVLNDTPINILPNPDQFKNIPYGIDQESYKNIFIKNQKIGSYWKWNYSSGILCWYRYYNIGVSPSDDPRPVPGVDLYIPPGDVFFATNDGPEPATDPVNPLSVNPRSQIQSCPSGLKLINNGEVTGIVPSGSQFCYISNNLYEKFYTAYNVINQTQDVTYIDAFKVAAVLATSPQYDKITVDLLKTNIIFDYPRNIYKQIDILNRDMQSGTSYDSVSHLNYISDKKELLTTLSQKYGAYLWVPPNTESTITFDKSISSSFALDIDFDMVIKRTDSLWRSSTCNPMKSCAERSVTKNFSYSQEIGFSDAMLKTETRDDVRYAPTCNTGDGSVIGKNFSLFSSVYINSSKIKSVFTSSGCIFFEDIYPRIAGTDTSIFCDNCDKNSSYYLIENVESAECGSKAGNDSFCYKTLARRFNNSPPQFPGDPSPSGTRTERTVADGTIRWKRGYKSLFFNPHIDLVAFHQEGGIFFNSVPLGIDNQTFFEKTSSLSEINIDQIQIKFATKDVGIKLYKLEAEYLQTSSDSSAKCKRFPVKTTCKCMPVSVSPTHPISCDDPNPSTFSSSNLYTPNVSTKYAPKLKKYGGYNQIYLDKIFNAGTLIAENTTLPTLSKKIDPLNPYGCGSNASITLRNYTNTFWNIDLNNFSTNHADIRARVTENVDLFAPQWSILIRFGGREEGLEYIPNKNYRRFTTKVSLEYGGGSTDLYANQSSVILNKDDSVPKTITAHLQNPFLEALMTTRGAKKDTVLYPPSGKLLHDFIFNPNSRWSPPLRGNETSIVTLSINQTPRKQILNFVVPPAQSMGILQKGFFHPNSGLTSSITDKTPIKNNKLFYDKPISDNVEYDEGFCLYGSLTQQVLNVIRDVNNFDKHRKLRLYLSVNDRWYEFQHPNRGGYLLNNQQYIGSPNIFEYISKLESSKGLPILLPAAPKKHIKYNYLYNHYKYSKQALPEFPLLSNAFSYNNSTKEITILGTRHYFMVPEIDPSIDTELGSMDDIANFNPSSPLDYAQMIRFADGSHWLCLKPEAPSVRTSYIWTDYDYLYHVFSDMHIDFNKISKQGYVYNTKKPCDFSFSTYNPYDKKWDTANKIISKKVLVKFVKKDGSPIRNLRTEDVYMIPYTVFTITLPIRNSKYTFIDLLGSANNPGDNKNFHSFTTTSITAPLAENDSKLLNKYIPSKWGDVINYDGTILDPYTDAFVNPEDFYPSSTYNNDFYKIIVNNHDKLKHNYQIEINGELINISHEDLVYYNILQPYNIGDNGAYSIQTQKYHNYLPFIDINLLSSEEASSIDQKIKEAAADSIKNNTAMTGTISMNGLLKNLSNFDNSFINPDTAPDPYFWINFTQGENLVKSAFVPTQTIYSPTLRFDDPPYWLSSTTVKNRNISTDSRYTCRERFEPQRINSYIATTTKFDNSSSFKSTTLTRQTPYFRYPIHCDTDDDTCANSGCNTDLNAGMMQVGWKELISNYRVGVEEIKNITTSSIPFILSYDAGIYNTVGNTSPITIKRFELEPNNEIEFDSFSCDNDKIFPANYKSSVINPIYQKTLDNTPDITHDLIVTNTDLVANEMLFRILYGEAQIINKKMLSINNKILSKYDLIQYSDPKVEAKDIYNQILYNFDKNAPMDNLNINGSLIVNGVMSVRSNTTIVINDITANLQIVKENNKIYIRGTIGDKNIDILIYAEVLTRKRYLIQQYGPGLWIDGTNRGNTWSKPAPPTSADENTTIVFQGQCNVHARRVFTLFTATNASFCSGQARSGVISDTSSYPCKRTLDTSNLASGGSVQAGFTNAEARWSRGFPGAISCWSNITNIPMNGEFLPFRQWVCGKPVWGPISFGTMRKEAIPYRCAYGYNTTGTDNCADFEVGYCRKKQCDLCDEVVENVDEINVKYEFQFCRTRFNLYGHAYRENLRPLPTLRRVPETYPTYSVQEYQDWVVGSICNSFFSPGPDAQYCSCASYGVSRCSEPPEMCGRCCAPTTCCICPPDCDPGCASCFRGDYIQASPEDDGISIGGGYWPQQPGEQYDPCADREDVCGVNSYGDRSVAYYRDIYLMTEKKIEDQYNPLCATPLVQINYTSKSLTFRIREKEYCFPVSLSTCPTINISSSMDQLYVDDTVDSRCENCTQEIGQLSVSDQKQNFLVRKEKRKCVLGVKYFANVNSRGIVGGGQIYYEYRGDYPLGSNSWRTQCGGGPIEYGCWEFGSTMGGWSDLFMPMGIECDRPITTDYWGSGSASLASLEVDEWKWELSQFLRKRYQYLSQGANHIPEEDIIDGIVPGSVSELQIESYNVGGQKITRGGGIVDNVVTAYIAYYEYDYIRPATLQDILRDDSSLICVAGREYKENIQRSLATIGKGGQDASIAAQQLYGGCPYVGFPPSYRDNLGDASGLGTARRYFYYSGDSSTPGAIEGSTYTVTSPLYNQNTNCNNSLYCSHKYNVYICPQAQNICCLADLEVIDNTGDPNCSSTGAPLCDKGSSATCSTLNIYPPWIQYIDDWYKALGWDGAPVRGPQFWTSPRF